MNGHLAVCMFVRVQTDLENQENLENSGNSQMPQGNQGKPGKLREICLSAIILILFRH